MQNGLDYNNTDCLFGLKLCDFFTAEKLRKVAGFVFQEDTILEEFFFCFLLLYLFIYYYYYSFLQFILYYTFIIFSAQSNLYLDYDGSRGFDAICTASLAQHAVHVRFSCLWFVVLLSFFFFMSSTIISKFKYRKALKYKCDNNETNKKRRFVAKP
jgi:hypothetical protein